MKQLRSERGQAAVLSVVFLVALLGMAALVLDVGSWFREQRDTQAAADAAVLAAAQALPDSPGEANALAASYVTKNDGGATTTEISSAAMANDTVTVEVERSAPGIFSKLFGIDSVQVEARASARVGGMDAARWVAPIVVNEQHPDLNCSVANGKPVPCFGKPTQIDLIDLHNPGSGDAAGAFGLCEGQTTVLIHSGSRGLGHQVCTDHVRTMDAVQERYGIVLPDRQLACAPASSPEGRRYLAAMAAAAIAPAITMSNMT